MTHLADFKSDFKWLAEHLRPSIRPEQARKSLELLEDLGLITYDQEAGRHFPTKKSVSSGDEIVSIAVIRYHQRMIEMAKESIMDIPQPERDISSVALSIPAAELPKFKKEISNFRKRVMSLSESAEPSDIVYQINIQLFPVSKNLKYGGDQ